VFLKLHQSHELLIEDEYGGYHYGVRTTDLESIDQSGKVPVLTLTPSSARSLLQNSKGEYLSIFLDADDAVLDQRLTERGSKIDRLEVEQRKTDRELSKEFVYTMRSTSTTVELLVWLWEHVAVGGVLPSKIIERMTDCGLLLQGFERGKISGASYDLSLGDEYFYGGNVHRLSDESPLLTINPYDYAIVTSREICNFPLDVCGRFDLSVSLFCQGIILSNGPQVDPGFRGPLFCLLFNTSSSSVTLKRGQHYATLEFHKLLESTHPYGGKYLGKSLIDYLPANVTQGAINELKKELEEVRGESRRLNQANWVILAITLGTLGILVSAFIYFVTFRTSTSTVTTTTTVSRSSFSSILSLLMIARSVVSRSIARRNRV
jgi:deoxycytidine triphosphate deaminase